MKQSVCISGASRGLGLAFTEYYLRAGAHVLAIARQAKEKETLKKLSRSFAGQLELFDADLTQAEDLLPLQQRWESETLDLLINNAGVLLDRQTEFAKLPLPVLRESFEVNVLAPVMLTQLALPALQRSKNPRVVMISSLLGSLSENSWGGYYAYRSSKVALNMITRSLAHDCPWLTSVTLHPGWVQTDMGGAEAPTTIAESINGLTRVIDQLKRSDSGQFRDYKGETVPW